MDFIINNYDHSWWDVALLLLILVTLDALIQEYL